MRTSLLVAAMIGLAACTDPKGATEALQDAGYKDIRLTGYSWTGCGDNDTYATGFEATSPGGPRVSGVVCSGTWLGKGATIRTFGRVRT